MKRKLLQALFAVTTVFSLTVQAQEALDCAVLSDIHILSPALLKAESEDFNRYIIHDRKLLRQGPMLLQTAIQQLLKQPQRPQVVLIPGDLTKDGERLSHELVADTLLRPLREANIQVFVVPGNHDVNNPHARCFERDTSYRTATVSAEEFADIYRDYGYGTSLARDAYSLSYVAQLNDSIRLLAIDACRYQDNDFQQNTCVTAGRIQPETWTFIQEQAEEAKKKHCKLVAMMHHGLVRHWKWQDRVMGDYLIKDWKQAAKKFGSLGIRTIFTGHFHAQDVATYGRGNKQIVDIETGSTVSYPMPMRRVRITTQHTEINSEWICRSELLPHAQQLEQEAIHYAKSGIQSLIQEMLPDKVPAEVEKLVCETVALAYLAHLAGDEHPSEEYLTTLKKACKQLRPYSWKYAFALKRIGRYLHTDRQPADNQIILPF